MKRIPRSGADLTGGKIRDSKQTGTDGLAVVVVAMLELGLKRQNREVVAGWQSFRSRLVVLRCH